MSNGEKNTRFRSRQKSIDKKIDRIERVLKDETSHRKTSMNQVLNFSVILADKYLEKIEEEIERLDKEKRELNESIQNLEDNISEATEF